MLLAQMEPQVMRMVDLHISKAEAGKVMEELKRKFDSDEIREKARKQIVARHPEERILIPAPMPDAYPAASPATPKKIISFQRSAAPSPEPDPGLQHATKGVLYGLNYHDRDLYSSPLSSPSSSSREPSPSPPTTNTADEPATTTEATKPAPKKSVFKKGRGCGRTGGIPYVQHIWKKSTLSPSKPLDESKLPPPVNRGHAHAQKRPLAENQRLWKRP